MNPRILLPAAAALVVLTACGGSSGGSSSGSASSASSSAASSGAVATWAITDCAVQAPPLLEPQPPVDSQGQDGVQSTVDVAKAPKIGIVDSAAPATSLVAIDLVPGSGTAVAKGGTVTVNYCGVGLATKTLFDSSWVRKEPISFPLGNVIQGWQEGLVGMQPGGRRLLIIPGDLAYGPQPPPGSGIKPNETLVFVVDLISSP